MKKLILSLIPVLFLNGCNWQRNVEEGDKNTYTWKGRLVEDCTEKPAANKEIYLKAIFSSLSGDASSEEIERTTTDADGNFSLTYKRIAKPSIKSVNLILEDGGFSTNQLLLGPVNRSVERDIAVNDCDLIYFDYTNISASDSLYLSIGWVENSDNLVSFLLPEIDTIYRYPTLPIKVKGTHYEELFVVKPTLSHTWDNQAQQYSGGIASSFSELRKILLSHSFDSVTYAGLEFDLNLRGYPKVDTLHLSF